MNGRNSLFGSLALFFLLTLLPILACDIGFGDDEDPDPLVIQMTVAAERTVTAVAAATAAPQQTTQAQWTAEANATLTAAASKEALTETAVWLGETATIIAHMTEVWGTPTPSATATATATPMATPTPTASSTPAGITQLLLDDPAGDAYNCAAGPGDVLTLQPFLLDARQAVISSDQQNLIAQVSFDEGVGDLGQSVQQTGRLWAVTLAGYDRIDLLPPADPEVYAAALGNFGFAVFWQGNQSVARGYDYEAGEWLAETVSEGVAFAFDGDSATMTIANTLLPDAGQFRLEVGYDQTQCDEVGSAGGPIIEFIKSSDPNYAFYFAQLDEWIGGP